MLLPAFLAAAEVQEASQLADRALAAPLPPGCERPGNTLAPLGSPGRPPDLPRGHHRQARGVAGSPGVPSAQPAPARRAARGSRIAGQRLGTRPPRARRPPGTGDARGQRRGRGGRRLPAAPRHPPERQPRPPRLPPALLHPLMAGPPGRGPLLDLPAPPRKGDRGSKPAEPGRRCSRPWSSTWQSSTTPSCGLGLPCPERATSGKLRARWRRWSTTGSPPAVTECSLATSSPSRRTAGRSCARSSSPPAGPPPRRLPRRPHLRPGDRGSAPDPGMTPLVQTPSPWRCRPESRIGSRRWTPAPHTSTS